MILKALCELAEEKGLAEDLDFMSKPVRYQVVVTRDGNASIVDMAVWEPAEGKKKHRLSVPTRRIPRQSVRTSGDAAEFLVDKCDYVFGCNPTAKGKVAERLSGRSLLFIDRVRNLLCALPDASEEHVAVRAVLDFLEDRERCEQTFFKTWQACADDKERADLASALFEFVFEPSSPTPIHLLPRVVDYWRAQRGDASQCTEGIVCLVSGQSGSPVETHDKVKGVWGGAAGGTTLVSFNADAFESYGLSRNENAPITRESAEKYVNALNWLLERRETRQNLRLSADSVIVFWAKDGNDEWVLPSLEGDTAESVKQMLRTPQRGRAAALENPSSFISLVLAGAQGRCVVRSYVETTVAEAATAMDRFLDETAIERPYGHGIGHYPLRDLVESTGMKGKNDTVVSAQLTTRLYLSALRGTLYPRDMLSATLRRQKAEISTDDNNKWARFAARAALLRAYLTRNEGMEVTVSLDHDNRQPAYLLGRLFATLDRTQQEALGSVNATIADRFYGAASCTPAAVFPTLLRRNQHHLSKLSKDKPGYAVNQERLLQEITGGLSSFKRTLSLEEQGLFALGFHHQRQSFFTKKDKETSK